MSSWVGGKVFAYFSRNDKEFLKKNCHPCYVLALTVLKVIKDEQSNHKLNDAKKEELVNCLPIIPLRSENVKKWRIKCNKLEKFKYKNTYMLYHNS